MTTCEATVFIVNHDPVACEAITEMMQPVGVAFKRFPTAEAFLDGYDSVSNACLVTDFFLPGMSGLELLKSIAKKSRRPPAIIVTAKTSIPLAVRAMRDGAFTVLEKPWCQWELCESIRNALSQDEQNRRQHQQRQTIRERISQLAPEHRHVLDMLLSGKTIAATAEAMGFDQPKVENLFQEVINSMQAESAAELTKFLLDAEIKYAG